VIDAGIDDAEAAAGLILGLAGQLASARSSPPA